MSPKDEPESSPETAQRLAREIMKLTADIAIMSVCDTARGRIRNGEGVIGMTWALFLAGCRTTVVSQWSVESRSTTRLMIEFHRALLGTQHAIGTNEKGSRAQLRMLHNPAYSHPFYWAGFVVVGDGW